MTGDWSCRAVAVLGMLVTVLLSQCAMARYQRRVQESLAEIRRGEARIVALTAEVLGRDV